MRVSSQEGDSGFTNYERLRRGELFVSVHDCVVPHASVVEADESAGLVRHLLLHANGDPVMFCGETVIAESRGRVSILEA